MVNTNLSLYFMKVGDKETAEAESAKAVQKEMARASGHRFDESTLDGVLEQERRADALRKKEMFGMVLEIDAEDGIALFGMGNALSILEDWDEAIAGIPGFPLTVYSPAPHDINLSATYGMDVPSPHAADALFSVRVQMREDEEVGDLTIRLKVPMPVWGHVKPWRD